MRIASLLLVFILISCGQEHKNDAPKFCPFHLVTAKERVVRYESTYNDVEEGYNPNYIIKTCNRVYNDFSGTENCVVEKSYINKREFEPVDVKAGTVIKKEELISSCDKMLQYIKNTYVNLEDPKYVVADDNY